MRTVYGANASPFVRKVRVFLTFPRKGGRDKKLGLFVPAHAFLS
jgi:hypothetical protein